MSVHRWEQAAEYNKDCSKRHTFFECPLAYRRPGGMTADSVGDWVFRGGTLACYSRLDAEMACSLLQSGGGRYTRLHLIPKGSSVAI
jgi:hypothetical protein